MANVKHVASRRGGYAYQSYVGVLRLIDVLAKRADSVMIEYSSRKSDIFDDIKVCSGRTIHHYQVKWGMNLDKPLRFSQFTNSSSDLFLVKLFDAWKHEMRIDITYYVHVYTNKQLDISDSWKIILKPATDEAKKFVDSPGNAFQFNEMALSAAEFSEVFTQLRNTASNINEISDFLQSLVLEVNQPTMLKKFEEDNMQQIEVLIRDRISNILGLDKPPNNKSSVDILNALVEICNRAAISGDVITQVYLANKLNIRLDYAPIDQEFEFLQQDYILTPASLEKITKQIKKSSGKLVGIKGLPGVGKSWLLSHWLNLHNKENRGTPGIMYYCFTRINDENSEVRITKQQLIQNFIFEILRTYPDVDSSGDKLLAATESKLIRLLEAVGEVGRSKDTVIPILVDGLDHIHRVRSRSGRLLPDEDIMSFLNCLNIPKGICLIVGTQPGNHLSKLQQRYGERSFITINGFTHEESEEYLLRHDISESKGIASFTIDTIIKRTKGLPLLLTYVARTLKGKINNNSLNAVLKSLKSANGDVRNYYEFLWKDLDTQSPSRQYARLLALLDFPASNDLLDHIIPTAERLDEPLEESLRRLSPLLRLTQQGVSFFHDSFRSFVLDDPAYGDEIRTRYYGRLYEYLLGIGIFANDTAFRKTLEFAYLARRDNDVLEKLTLDFIDNAIEALFTGEDIINNINVGRRAALRKCDLALFVKNALLLRYTKERLDYNISFPETIETLAEVGSTEVVRRAINARYDELSQPQIIKILSITIDRKIDLPMNEVMEDFHRKSKASGNILQEGIDISDYAKVITHTYGLEYTLDWVQKKKALGNSIEENALMSIGSNCTSKEIERLSKKINLSQDEIIILMSGVQSLGRKEQLKIFSRILEKYSPLPETVIYNAVRVKIPKKLVRPYAALFVPSKPGGFPGSKEISDLYKLQRSAFVLSYCGSNDQLETILKAINKYPNTSARLLQELMVILSRVDARILLGMANCDDAEQLLRGFERLANHKTAEGLEPRDLDCIQLRTIARYIMTSLVERYLQLSNSPQIKLLLELIRKLNSKFAWNVRGTPWIFISTEEAIECLSVIAKKFPSDELIKDEAKQVAESFRMPGYTSDRVSQLLQRARLYHQCGMSRESEESYKRAIKASHAYGYHKDLLLYELHMVGCKLNEVSAKDSLRRASDILELSEYLWQITDHDETRYIPGYVAEEVLKRHKNAGFRLITQFVSDKFELAYLQGVRYCILNMKASAPILRFLLTEMLPCLSNHYNNEYWMLELKLSTVKAAIACSQNNNAIFMMKRIRSFLELYPNIDRRQLLEFNRLAQKLNLPEVKLPPEQAEIITRKKDSMIELKKGTLNTVIAQFKRLSRENRYEAGPKLFKILSEKVATLSLADLYKLTKFILSPYIISHGAEAILYEISVRYRKIGSDKADRILIKAFETGWGWTTYSGVQDRVHWLTSIYNQNKQRGNALVLSSFSEVTKNGAWDTGAITRLAEYLLQTKQYLQLEQLYCTNYDFCITFFRDYEGIRGVYSWMKRHQPRDISESALIIKLLLYQSKSGPKYAKALSKIGRKKNMAPDVDKSAYQIIEEHF